MRILRLEQLLHFYEDMLRIRFFEEKIRDDLYPSKHMRGGTHLYIGQEAVAVGALHATEPEDYVISTHRGHGHALAKGCDPKRMFAELCGRRDGYSKGKGGSMHIADRDVGFLGENPVVAANIPMAAGVALACKTLGNDRIVVDFFGEGATNNGAFHEALNMAGLWDLPVVFICENNLYAISVPVEQATAIENIQRRADAYGMPGKRENGMDVSVVYHMVAEAARLAREASQPSLLVFDCYRFEGHHMADQQPYRSKDEPVRMRREHDPIHILEREMLEDCLLEPEQVVDYRERIRAEIDEAAAQALKSPEPAPEEALEDLYA
ncbi:MAG: thiamine pyrophosphate-dependent enzyme [Armatimonadota bacterium]